MIRVIVSFKGPQGLLPAQAKSNTRTITITKP